MRKLALCCDHHFISEALPKKINLVETFPKMIWKKPCQKRFWRNLVLWSHSCYLRRTITPFFCSCFRYISSLSIMEALNWAFMMLMVQLIPQLNLPSPYIRHKQLKFKEWTKYILVKNFPVRIRKLLVFGGSIVHLSTWKDVFGASAENPWSNDGLPNRSSRLFVFAFQKRFWKKLKFFYLLQINIFLVFS